MLAIRSSPLLSTSLVEKYNSQSLVDFAPMNVAVTEQL